MDSTLRSNISVGLPLDLLIYESDKLAVSRFVTIDEKNQYFQMIRNSWGGQLKSVFEGIANPVWNAAPETTANVLTTASTHSQPCTHPCRRLWLPRRFQPTCHHFKRWRSMTIAGNSTE